MKWAKSDPLVGIRFSDLSKIGGATPFPASLRLIPGTTNFSFEFHKKQVYEEKEDKKTATELVEILYKKRKKEKLWWKPSALAFQSEFFKKYLQKSLKTSQQHLLWQRRANLVDTRLTNRHSEKRFQIGKADGFAHNIYLHMLITTP